jgi:hypothetical protein
MKDTDILYDWILTPRCVRGSFENDHGNLMSASAKPVKYLPESQEVVLENGRVHMIPEETMCVATSKVKEVSEKTMKALKNAKVSVELLPVDLSEITTQALK